MTGEKHGRQEGEDFMKECRRLAEEDVLMRANKGEGKQEGLLYRKLYENQSDIFAGYILIDAVKHEVLDEARSNAPQEYEEVDPFEWMKWFERYFGEVEREK